MWEVSEGSMKLLNSWAAGAGSSELRDTVERWSKKKPLTLDFDEINSVLEKLVDEYPIYKFIDGLRRYVPKVERKIDPAYAARIEKLKKMQEDRQYKEMTRSVDPNQHYGRVNFMQNFGEEMKSVNRHLIAVLNAVITVAGAFCFGFYGATYAYPSLDLDIPIRMAIGLVLGTVVFFADLYFLIKGMDDKGEQPVKQVKRKMVKLDFRHQKDTTNDKDQSEEALKQSRETDLKMRRRKSKKID